jgi:hypothetical protein
VVGIAVVFKLRNTGMKKLVTGGQWRTQKICSIGGGGRVSTNSVE